MNRDNERVQATFAMDFSIADRFGKAAVKDTMKRAFNEWKTSIKYATELVIALNLKCWEHHRRGDFEMSKLYADEFHRVDSYVLSHFSGDDIRFYLDVTD